MSNLEEIKAASKRLYLNMSMEEASAGMGDLKGLFMQHPYSNSPIVSACKNGEMVMLNILENPEDEMIFRRQIFNQIEHATEPNDITWIVNKPYRLLWFKLVKEFLTAKEYGELLSEIWIQSENPNDDVNVGLDEAISYFKSAKKHYLMNRTELEAWKAFPQEVIVYRGVSRGRNPYGLSYTTNKEKAEWFQRRYANDSDSGFLIERTINRSDILAYFDRRGEFEVVVDTTSLLEKGEWK